MSAQFWKKNKSSGSKDNPYISKVAPFLLKKNFLGEILNPHLHVVMEIMYHNMLKAGPLREQFTETFPEFYGFMRNSTTPKFGFDSLYTFNVSDYIKTDELPFHPHLHYSTNPGTRYMN